MSGCCLLWKDADIITKHLPVSLGCSLFHMHLLPCYPFLDDI